VQRQSADRQCGSLWERSDFESSHDLCDGIRRNEERLCVWFRLKHNKRLANGRNLDRPLICPAAAFLWWAQEYSKCITIRSLEPQEKKRVAIVQSNYIPWKGYFDLVHSVDEFVLFDDVQFTRRDWRNRNKIKSPQGLKWLTIPVEVKGKYLQKIQETAISDSSWAVTHWKTLQQFYSNAPFWGLYHDLLEDLYLDCTSNLLSVVNQRFLSAICRTLNITTRITSSANYALADGKTERLISICKQSGAGNLSVRPGCPQLHSARAL
jgi:hypothetical protein